MSQLKIDDIKQIIETNDAVMLYFSGKNCNVCHALQPKIKEAFDTNFPKIKQLYIDATDNTQLAASYEVFSVPTILIFFDKKETKRVSRYISVSELIHDISRLYNLMF